MKPSHSTSSEGRSPVFEIFILDSAVSMRVSGTWTLPSLNAISTKNTLPADYIQKNPPTSGTAFAIDCLKLDQIDTSGAMLLLQQLQKFGICLENVELTNCDQQSSSVIRLMFEKLESRASEQTKPVQKGFADNYYKAVLHLWQAAYEQIAFLGHVVSALFAAILSPSRFRLKELFIQLERSGISSIPIVSLVTFLIGLVVAYLFANQAAKFGANIFIVDAVGMGITRELSPVLVAILCAGRSGSAFTAQIGTMKINEEIDAIRVLGLSPMDVLVIPRIVALMITLPLLVVVGNIFGILGGIVIASTTLDVTVNTFLTRLPSVLAIRHVVVGLVKAPVFAFVIAFIGCRLGLTVENNARSVGLHTTSTVVQSIVAVILLNAAFAVLFQELRL